MNDLILQIANILAPTMILAAVGLIWHHKGPTFPVDFVTTLVLNVSLPALLFHTLATADVPIETLGQVALASLALHIVFTLVAITLLTLSGKQWRLFLTFVIGNTGNLGLPVCYLAYGDEGLAYAMAFFSVQCILLFSVGEGLYAGKIDIGRIVRSPILIAIALGVTVQLTGWQAPQIVMVSTELLGQIVIPIMLLTLGISLGSLRASNLPSTVIWSTLRTLLAAVTGFGFAALFGLDGAARGVLILETMMPVAVFNYLLAVKHQRDEGEVAGMILVTHIAAIFYLPVVLTILA